MLQDLPLACEWFDLFKAVLMGHIQQENEALLPRFEALGLKGQWPLLVYQKEHEKIAQLLDKTSAMLTRLPAGPHAEGRRNILAVLEYQRTLKNVIEHHEEREEKGMLPELDGALPEAERLLLAEQCHAVWHALEQTLAPRRLALLERLQR